jgi:anaerobic ribonucleoside-triphosphate reductase activating protein
MDYFNLVFKKGSNKMNIKVSNIIEDSIVDGVGLRLVYFISGCTHKCDDCFSPQTWDVDSGVSYNINCLVDYLNELPLHDVTISGGDGLTLQYNETFELCKQIKEKTNKSIWLYTGYTYEYLINSDKKDILNYIDVIVDGRFEKNNSSLDLVFKGSSNQRILDVKTGKDLII